MNTDDDIEQSQDDCYRTIVQTWLKQSIKTIKVHKGGDSKSLKGGKNKMKLLLVNYDNKIMAYWTGIVRSYTLEQ